MACRLVFLGILVIVTTGGVDGQLRGKTSGGRSGLRERNYGRRSGVGDTGQRREIRHPSRKKDQRGRLIRHLREKIMDAEEGETRKRLRAHLAFLYDLPIDQEDEQEIEIMLDKINRDDKKNKVNHRRLLKKLARFMKWSRRRHRVEHTPDELHEAHEAQEELRRQRRKMKALKPRKGAVPEFMKGKPRQAHGLKPKPGRPTLGGNNRGSRKRPVFHSKKAEREHDEKLRAIHHAHKHAEKMRLKAAADYAAKKRQEALKAVAEHDAKMREEAHLKAVRQEAQLKAEHGVGGVGFGQFGKMHQDALKAVAEHAAKLRQEARLKQEAHLKAVAEHARKLRNQAADASA